MMKKMLLMVAVQAVAMAGRGTDITRTQTGTD